MLTNRLARTASPYLRAHAGDPVNWQPWDAQAFAAAVAGGLPVLLSIGYSACHWCHVMAEESFADPATAAVINRLFVPIKVDREERPDLDRLFLGAMAALGVSAGWPLTAFLTQAGEPYAGGGYYPKHAAFGLPAFVDVLEAAAAWFAADPAAAARQGGLAVRPATPRGFGTTRISRALLDRVARGFAGSVDTLYGGFGIEAPKFLHAGGHEIILRAAVRCGDAALREAALGSLRMICHGAVYDHVGGGFHRYAADDRWQVPHFEKMLCDNALMLSVLTRAWQASGETLFAEHAAGTADWMLREMRLPDGGFAASQAADRAGPGGEIHGEGVAYSWAPGEIATILGERYSGFAKAYGQAADGPFAPRSVIFRQPGADPAPGVLAMLLEARRLRPAPLRDDKRMADWNGLAIAALAEAGLAFERPEWIAAARGAFAATCRALDAPEGLRHAELAGIPGPPGFLEDHAAMAQAALALHEVGADPAFVERAARWVAALDAGFWDEAGGYFTAPADPFVALPRHALIDETAAPSGNGTMLGVLPRLAALTGQTRHHERAEAIMRRFADRLTRASVAGATALNNSLALDGLTQVVVVGDDAAAAALRRAVTTRLVADRLLVLVPKADDAPASVGKTLLPGGVSAGYVCVGTSCLAPVTTPDSLGALLHEARPEALPLDSAGA